MFLGSWIINITFSVIAFLIVFIGSTTNNTVITSLYRGCLAFVSFYIIAYLFRWLWYIASCENDSKSEKKEIEPDAKGNDSINDISFSNEEIEKASKYVKDLINE